MWDVLDSLVTDDLDGLVRFLQVFYFLIVESDVESTW